MTGRRFKSSPIRLATAKRYAQIVLLRAPMFVVALIAHYHAAHAFGIHIPFGQGEMRTK